MASQTVPATSTGVPSRRAAWQGIQVTESQRLRISLCLLVLLAFALRVGFASAFPNFFRPDEIYQTMEPAYRLVNGWGVVTWEWREGIRSWMFPGFLAGLLQVAARLGLTHDGTTLLITAVMSLSGTAMVAGAFAVGWRHGRWTGALVCGLLVASWPDLVYFGPKTLTEIQSGHLLAIAFCLACLMKRASRPVAQAACIGVLLGLAFCLRIQLAPALLPVAIAACGTDLRRRWVPLLLAGLVPVMAMGLIDLWTLGSPFQSVWKYFQVNVIEGRSLKYGIEGPFWYLRALVANWGVALPFLALFFVVGARKLKWGATAAIAVLLVHSLVAHKEYSFIYAAFPLLLIVAGIGAADVVAGLIARHGSKLAGGPLTAGTLALCLCLSVAAALGGGYRQGARAGSVNLIGMSAVRDLPDICGLGLHNAGWPSYAIIDRRIPTYLTETPADVAAMRRAANYFLVEQSRVKDLPWASVLQCQRGLCLLHSQNSCTPVPDYEANLVIERAGY